MEFEWIAIALGGIAPVEIAWLAVAFALGLLSRSAGLPPLVGFLAAGFVLNLFGIASGDMLEKLADLGVTLLLFIVGLKLNLRTLVRPQVWAVTSLHMALIVPILGTVLLLLALLSVSSFTGIGIYEALLIAFALSFSSTVFVVKVLEDRGETAALHGRIAVGILIVQDLAAVAFIAVSAGMWPSPWALMILLLIPARPLLIYVLGKVGHGELLVLCGLLLALGGAAFFELVGLKGDLGALVLGALIANSAKANEMAKTMLGFKDLFLVAFFLSIGLSGPLTLDAVLIGAAVTPLVILKSALFFGLLTVFKLRARTSLLATLNLTNFSEFGLIVAAIGVSNGWIDTFWLIVVAIALTLSCALSAGLNVTAHQIYARHRKLWDRLQKTRRLADDQPLDIGGATTAIIGMGRVGTAAYDQMHQAFGGAVVGVEIDPVRVERQQSSGRHVLLGDPTDADFWDRVQAAHTLELVLLALPNLASNLAVLDQLNTSSSYCRVAATARFPDEVEVLRKAGAASVYNLYAEAGSGFAAHVAAQTPSKEGGKSGA